MSLIQERRESLTASSQDVAGALDASRRGADRLTIEQVNARFLHYAGTHWRRSVYRFLKLKGVAVGRRSRRCLLIKQSELERALGGASPRHQQRSA